MDMTFEFARIFKEDTWNTSVKVVQKSIDYSMFKKETTCTIDVPQYDTTIRLINCADSFFIREEDIGTDVTNNEDFANNFNELCKQVIDKDFKMFRGDYTIDNWFECFMKENHGSGVTALFWVFYQMRIASVLNIDNIIVSNIDGTLHPISMEALARVLKKAVNVKVILSMNQDILMSTRIMDIDDLYVMHDNDIKCIRQCTDRELRIAHNLQSLYRAGEFD